ncbi:hypothetical protein QBC38DRAFT_429020 [Podospora fimiseda]|uniref:NACHT domain-containing protein n=1 Tax=Podospora fimiseda TaxID=252190 RepID=A0AAN6YPD5_9PEZI|nr:hypothetical protein QBC38DRAFT_429020 [Podospora fimiseda]
MRLVPRLEPPLLLCLGRNIGVARGAPSPRHDIRLGDVVVGYTDTDQQPIFQYDFGKIKQDGQFQITRLFNQPPIMLLTAVQDLKIDFQRRGDDHGLQANIDDILGRSENQYFQDTYCRPSSQGERLYRSDIAHKQEADKGYATTCGDDDLVLVPRLPRQQGREIVIHYGRVACGNSVVKDAQTRDSLSSDHDILCFEMESAGLMYHFPCLVIHGICDYSDSHKTKEWQPYAAMTAASYARRVLAHITPRTLTSTKSMAIFLEEQDQKILDWILSPQYTERYMSKHDEVLRMWHRKTGSYLLDSVELLQWIKTTGGTLFCYGDPGAGKTVIASAVIDSIHKVLENHTDQGLAYFYAVYKNAEDQSVPQTLRSLLKALGTRRRRTSNQLPVAIKRLYEKCQRLSKVPSDEELVETIEGVVDDFDKFFLVIDAMDELPPESQFRVGDVLHTLRRKTGKMNILVTSIRSEEIEALDVFTDSSCAKFEIRAKDDDIRVYLEGQLGGLHRKWARDEEMKSEILTAIPQTAQGMFLAARLLMDQIAPRRLPGHVKDDLRRASKQGIGGINQIYEQAMIRIMAQSEDDRCYAVSALGWLTRARRPLTAPELLRAIAIYPEGSGFDPDYLPESGMLQSICNGLIIVDAQGVRFVHYTTQEFFDENQSRFFPGVEAEITIKCATFMGIPPLGLSGWDKPWNPLHYYAMDYWMEHAKVALREHTDTSSPVFKALLDFLGDNGRVKVSNKIGCYGTTGLHLAAMYGLSQLIKPLVGFLPEKNPTDAFRRTPLSRAAKLGLIEVVKELVSIEGVDPDATCIMGGSPLWYTIQTYTETRWISPRHSFPPAV